MDDMGQENLMTLLKQKMGAVDVDGKFANENVPPHIVLAFQNCLLYHPDGPIVLQTLGERLNFLRKGASIVELMERNIFLEILTMCGIQEDDIIEAIVNIVKEKTNGA